MNIVEVTEKLFVSAQPQLNDFANLKAQGFTTVINNRPDGEEPAQPSSAAEEDAGWAAGLAYLHIPVTSTNMTSEAVRHFKDAIDHAPGPVLAHCRNGARSFYLWVLSTDQEEYAGPATPLSSRPGLASKRSATRNGRRRAHIALSTEKPLKATMDDLTLLKPGVKVF